MLYNNKSPPKIEETAHHQQINAKLLNNLQINPTFLHVLFSNSNSDYYFEVFFFLIQHVVIRTHIHTLYLVHHRIIRSVYFFFITILLSVFFRESAAASNASRARMRTALARLLNKILLIKNTIIFNQIYSLTHTKQQ